MCDACSAPWKHNQVAETYSQSEVQKYHREIDGLNWQFGGEKMRYNFLRRAEFLPHMLVYRYGKISPLLEEPRPDLKAFVVESKLGPMTLDKYIQNAPVNGIIILHHNRIIYERYPRMRPFDKHLLMSVSKVYVATVIALLQARGQIDIRQNVESLLPETIGSGWQGVTVQDVLDMASGINATEELQGFTDPNHPYYGYEASLGWLPISGEAKITSTYDIVARLKRKDAPGQFYEYTSVNTFILAWIAERLTNLPLAEILTREIWSRIGAEADALLAISSSGAPAAHGGLTMCLRDLARFGLIFTPGGRELVPGLPLPEGFLGQIQRVGRPEIFMHGPTGPRMVDELHGEQPLHNCWQWDYVLPDGDFFKGGYGGQGLYCSPQHDLVLAYFGSPFDEQMQTHELQWITRQLLHSGLLKE